MRIIQWVSYFIILCRFYISFFWLIIVCFCLLRMFYDFLSFFCNYAISLLCFRNSAFILQRFIFVCESFTEHKLLDRSDLFAFCSNLNIFVLRVCISRLLSDSIDLLFLIELLGVILKDRCLELTIVETAITGECF